jgi:hypothetical protein
MRMSISWKRRVTTRIFKDDEDAVPIAGTVATVFAINGNGVVTKSDANLLGDNYWGIANVLSR